MSHCCVGHSRAKFVFIFWVFISMISLPTYSFSAEWQNKYDFEQVRSQFSQPPLFYAPHTFWFWDAPLDPQQTASMAGEMTRQRLNPGYAHPRHSGDPSRPYPTLPKKQWLSPLWFQSFDAALQEAEGADMTLGYCDEFWWPSGQAAGRVLEQHPELKAQSLKWERRQIDGPTTFELPDALFSVAAQLSHDGLINASSLKIIEHGQESWSAPSGTWVLYAYKLFHHAGADGGKVNYLDPKLMDVFIPIAHESYEKQFKEKMGSSMPGVFVDNEGDYGWKMAWSDYLAERYMEVKSRDIRLWLPLLTEKDDAGLWAKARYDWFDVVSDVYTNQFLGRLSDWLGERNMYCISNLWEESLMLQTRAVGDFMRAQRSVSMPGNDCLQMKSQQVHDFKETQSVCEFDDKPFMSELMGVAGWEQTPVQMKQTLNAVTAWGVTHNVPHGINLNRKLETIPYPADWFTENPYWRYMHLWTDFARRASFVNRQGRLVADVLLINPLESVWALSEGYFTGEDGNTWSEKVERINSVYSTAMHDLSRSWLDYLIADSHYMQATKVVDHNSAEPVLRIGSHSFSTIVLPPMFILSHATMDKLLRFAQTGGAIICLGDLPEGSPENGAIDPEMRDKVRTLQNLVSVIDLSSDPSQLADAISEKINTQMEMQSGDLPLLVSHRKICDSDFYWLANNTERTQECRLSLRDGAGRAEIWNCENGNVQPVFYKKKDGRNVAQVKFDPFEAFWLVFNADEKLILEQDDKELKNVNELVLSDSWRVSFPETKKILLSSVRSFNTAESQTNTAFLAKDFDDSDWKWQDIIGPIRLEDDWRANVLYVPEPRSNHYFRYKFHLDKAPESGIVNLNADNAVSFTVNGRPVPAGPHANSFSNVDIHDIGSLLQKGDNVISINVWNNMGFGWLIMQGAVQMVDGTEFEIVTDKSWKASGKEIDDWQTLEFDDSSWKAVQLADPEMETREKRSLKNPQKIAFAKNSIWWRMPVPPGAVSVKLPGLSARAELWLDGKPLKANSNVIELAENRMLAIKISAGDDGLDQPAEFTVNGAAQCELDSWRNMGMIRFTGFVDYEGEFSLEDVGEATIDLGKVLHMAEVWINGQWAGERLWPPFQFDVTPYIKSGKNKIRVRVGNLMVNEMGLKDDLDLLRHWGWSGTPPDSCFDAGLFGPVKIVSKNQK
jgi:hypothetical protein